MTGVARRKKKHPEQRARARIFTGSTWPTLWYGTTAFNLVTALTGIPANNWNADCVENAFLIQTSLHDLFGAFQLYLEWVGNQVYLYSSQNRCCKPPFRSKNHRQRSRRDMSPTRRAY
ncbi:hypothetical protein BT96DRAFT_65853 [Gymnopus androsaceus JB14]|uniref:Uncharacterized protein n=1 Tax=Gymnopus androsaceus JB14 TaxID=1447944 RepID=A0A6A4HIX7_9AGAR|nr:hypothetical protein BT96DRAFT_65853 [Gymnopus androsaceus JB14]